MYQVLLLGCFRIEAGDGGAASASAAITRFRTQKTAALLAYLVCHGDQLHSREALIDRLWPDARLDAGRVSLRTALASLRRQLEPPGVAAGSVLVADRTHVRLEPRAFATDVACFEREVAAARRAVSPGERVEHLHTALDRYVGPLLPGFYEDWTLRRREHLSELYRQAVGQMVTDLGRAGDLSGALSAARCAVAADPQDAALGEVLHRLLAAGDKPVGTTASLSPTNALAATIPTPVARADEKPQPAARGNLPMPLSRFFGRAREMAMIADALRDTTTRLLTLVGPGGTGKTRLAVESAAQLRDGYPGGVYFVSLADSQSGEQIVPALREALGLPRPASASADPLAPLVAALTVGERPTLLILDNLEQITVDAPAVVLRLLNGAPNVQCLATSRRRLALPGEQVQTVAPLPVPAVSDEPSPDTLAAVASVQLFADRARACRPDFQITARNAQAVAALCADLEGIPLSIELAAAWSRALSPAQIRERLSQRFALLRTRPRQEGDRSPRHASLAATVAWSVDLLAPDQQRFFARLSAFRGGWTADAAQAVCDEPHALDLLALLSERSLIRSEEMTTGEIRFGMLETLREFAADRLGGDEADDLRARHRRYFVDWTEETAVGPTRHLTSAGLKPVVLDRVAQEMPNLRAILDDRSRNEATRTAQQSLFGALGNFWAQRGDWLEAWRCAKNLLGPFDSETSCPATAFASDPFLLARAALAAALLARGLSKYPEGYSLLECGLAAARRARDPVLIAETLCLKATFCLRQSDFAGSVGYNRRALRFFRRLNHATGSAKVHLGLGNTAMDQNDLAAAERHFAESQAFYHAANDASGIARILGNRATIAYHRNEMERSRTLREEALAIMRELEDENGVAIQLGNLALIDIEQKRLQDASLHFAEAERIHRRLGDQDSVANIKTNASAVAVDRGDLPLARTLLEDALAIYRRLGGGRQIATVLVNLGNVARLQNDLPGARAAYRESLVLFSERNIPVGIAYALEGIALLYDTPEKGISPAASVRLFGAARALRLTIDYPLPPSSVPARERLHEKLRADLGDSAYDAALAEGMVMPLADAITLAADL